MRVLMISPRVSGIGGVAQHVSKLVEKLRGVGYDVDVISAENTPHIPAKKFYNPSFAITSALKTVLSGTRYNVVHGHNLPSYLALKSCEARVRILTLHGIYTIQVKTLYGKFIGKLAELLETSFVRGVDAITCISKSAYQYYKRLSPHVIYIPNAIDLNDLPSGGMRLYERQVVFVGRLSLEKGLDVLLQAMKGVEKDIHVLIAGSGPMLQSVLGEIAKRPNLHYLGYLPRKEALKLIKGSDLLVLPSRVEGLPTVLLEAMALKTPILATRIPEIVEVLGEDAAILVEPESPSELARAINQAIYSYPTEYVSRAFERVVKNFTWDIVFEKYLKLYNLLTTS